MDTETQSSISKIENDFNGMGDNEQDEGNDEILINSEDVRLSISQVFDKLKTLELERSAINSDIKSELDNLEAKGVNRKAAKSAFKRFKLSEEEREAMDFSYEVCCSAVGVQSQLGLFDEHHKSGDIMDINFSNESESPQVMQKKAFDSLDS